MARFEYVARDNRRARVSGEIECRERGDVADQLLSRGLTPVQILELPEPVRWLESLRRLSDGALRPEDLVFFCRQMYSVTKGGVPIHQGMKAIADTTRHRLLRDALRDCRRQLEEGRALSDAMAAHSDVFGALLVNLVRVGEETGRLEQAFHELQRNLDSEQTMRRHMSQALRYPLMVLAALALAFGAVNLLVVPAFARVFANFNAELPWMTRALMWSSDWMVAWWPVLLGGTAVAVLATRAHLRTDAGKLAWGRWSLRLPLIGPLRLKATLSRFARALSMCARSGIVMDQALRMVAVASDNRFFASRLAQMREGVAGGESLTSAARRSEMFTPLVMQMLAIGEESGQLEDMLDEVGDFYEREVDYGVRKLGDYIEPVLLIAASGLVLMLALGIFLPMWDLARVALAR